MNADQLIAHRGWQRRYPENTLLAIEGAIQAGARHIEIDIQLSRDGIPFLLHNRDLNHMTGNNAAAHQLAWIELQNLFAAESLRFKEQFAENSLCTLDDVVALIKTHPQIHLYVELKRIAIENFSEKIVVDAVLQSILPIADQCTLISFWLPALVYAKQCGFQRLGPVLVDWQQVDDPELIALSPSVIFCDSEKVPANRYLNDFAWPFAIYEVDTIENVNYWLSRGARWIETFAIGELLSSGERQQGE